MVSRSNNGVRETWTISIGVAIWMVLAILSGINWIRLDLIEVLFLMAPWIIVPAGSVLITPVDRSPLSKFVLRPTLKTPVAAALATSSFFVPAGKLAGALASLWFLLCLVLACDGLLRFWNYRFGSFPQFCFAAGEGYVAVGGAWLVMSRLGLQPTGFVEPIVLLTAVHFHFAGFLSCIFAGLTYDRLRETAWAKPMWAVLLAVTCGPGLLGLAFLIGPKLKLFAAMLLAIGQVGLAIGMVRVAKTQPRGVPKVLLLASALSVAAAMVFAAAWALGEFPLQPMTDLSQMEHIHGVLNAAGFGFLGVLGWKGITLAELRS